MFSDDEQSKDGIIFDYDYYFSILLYANVIYSIINAFCDQ